MYLKLCKDHIWSIRKACVESLVQVSAVSFLFKPFSTVIWTALLAARSRATISMSSFYALLARPCASINCLPSGPTVSCSRWFTGKGCVIISFQKNYIYDTFIVSVAKLRWLIRQSNMGSAAKKTATNNDTPFSFVASSGRFVRFVCPSVSYSHSVAPVCTYGVFFCVR